MNNDFLPLWVLLAALVGCLLGVRLFVKRQDAKRKPNDGQLWAKGYRYAIDGLVAGVSVEMMQIQIGNPLEASDFEKGMLAALHDWAAKNS